MHDLLDVLGHPAETFPVALTKDDRAHKYFDGADVGRELHLAFAGGVGQAKGMTEMLFRDGTREIYLVAQDKEGHLGQFLNPQQTLDYDKTPMGM